MPFSIDTFNAEIAKNGVGRTTYFEGWILGAGGLTAGTIGSPTNPLRQYGSDQTRFRIESLNWPGRNMMTLEQNYHGPVKSLPYRAAYQTCSMGIILSQDYREREMFMRWQDLLLGNYRSNWNRSEYVAKFDTPYYNSGAGTIAIVQYAIANPNGTNNIGTSGTTQGEQEYSQNYIIILEEAFPINVQDIAMAWNDEGYAKLQVEIRYHYTTERHLTYSNQTGAENDRSKRQMNNI
jgi:hypothetical protein